MGSPIRSPSSLTHPRIAKLVGYVCFEYMQMYDFGFSTLASDFVKGIRRSRRLRLGGSSLSTHYPKDEPSVGDED